MTELFDARFRDMVGLLLRRIGRLRGRRDDELRARRLVSAATGSFAGHRAYSSGEDLRYVDWNVYARTGDLFLKLLEEDERHTLNLLLDCSPSMLAGEEPRFYGARRLAAILGGLAIARLDGVRIVAGPGAVVTLEGSSKLPRLYECLATLDNRRTTPLELARIPVERGWSGSFCWVSDFAVPEEFPRALQVLRAGGRQVTGVLPANADDRLPAATGWLRLRDPETDTVEPIRIDERLRRAMEQELHKLARQQDSVFAAAGCRLTRFAIPEPGDYRLSSWFPGKWIYRI